MICQLWVKGQTVSEGGLVFRDYAVAILWDSSQPMPTLTAYYTGVLGGRSFTQYTVNPAVQFGDQRWYEYPTFYLRECKGIDPDKPFDCVNGNCLPKETYNTPGKYLNLAACKAGCAKDSNCDGECVSAAEIAALQAAANSIRRRLCG